MVLVHGTILFHFLAAFEALGVSGAGFSPCFPS